ncbi:hypothetical protein GDO78_015790 [Eleutherodactylus coqui]|uniref:Uncharacterized protein n=1 Tax=Eleutherodactylus coqui TaxID=57060 RepID=A0A8J6ED98_ELECQ|nr:hypothetical protein GDO78_015790 [Eleutherodactylus coqui]
MKQKIRPRTDEQPESSPRTPAVGLLTSQKRGCYTMVDTAPTDCCKLCCCHNFLNELQMKWRNVSPPPLICSVFYWVYNMVRLANRCILFFFRFIDILLSGSTFFLELGLQFQVFRKTAP